MVKRGSKGAQAKRTTGRGRRAKTDTSNINVSDEVSSSVGNQLRDSTEAGIISESETYEVGSRAGETVEQETLGSEAFIDDKARAEAPKKKQDSVEAGELSDTITAGEKKGSKVGRNVEYYEEKTKKAKRARRPDAQLANRFRKKEGLKGEHLQQWLERMSTPKYVNRKKAESKKCHAFGGSNTGRGVNGNLFPN
uniref:Sas10 domain-containing protein n=1 Tax=Syphacia muris TaxID=451379 RepID=A0A0N5AFK5_9BILA